MATQDTLLARRKVLRQDLQLIHTLMSKEIIPIIGRIVAGLAVLGIAKLIGFIK